MSDRSSVSPVEHDRGVCLCVGSKEATDTIVLWRYALAHVLEPDTDRVFVVHVRTQAPSGWSPLGFALSVHGDEAGWLPEEMRLGLKAYESEYWELKGSIPESVAEFLTRVPTARLLIAGSRGLSRMERIVSGSGSTSKALANACTSVATLIVRAPLFVAESPPFRLATDRGLELEQMSAAAIQAGRSFLPRNSRAIAIAIDGSESSGVILGYTMGMFLRPEDHVLLCHVRSGDEYTELTASAQLSACSAELHKFLVDERNLSVLRLPPGNAKASLISALETEGPFDCVVVGSRGLSPLRRLAQRMQLKGGSVSAGILEAAPCPSLVVPMAGLLNWLHRGSNETPATPKQQAEAVTDPDVYPA